MTYLLSIDPGKNTGIAIGYYDAITPYILKERWQVHGGVAGFCKWWDENAAVLTPTIIVCEKFILDSSNRFLADLTPVEIEGALTAMMFPFHTYIVWQPRTDKAALTGYPATALTKSARQRARFDFLKRFGLFKPGTDNDDGNDAITHALVYLKRRRHAPTLQAFWPERARELLEPVSFVGASF
jgi:hypothetical protein